ncbi:2Fe-2S iron-sulfur cluster-binding protein [Pseudomonas songnenensis]|uniref:2Fe-2S iron-sulfur cluster binding domain-containing protein n=1 Tax=Pseudomonas songnenensis TaxID=1176259 RepID=A0A482UJQ5_9PSED|nr:2Fe-2S iron-sulfur cluster-binding protein [Pseudomonas songnenensis]RYJ62378.1 2Fe-2S iron-sulfur cluster binding domain-containing protein [Pseudomonas songnenensis]
MAAFKRFRLFHWLLAGFFVAAYLSGDDAELLHVWLGYGLVALLVLRVLIAPLRLRGFPGLLPATMLRRNLSLTSLGSWLTVGMLVSLALASLLGLGMVDNGDVLAALPGVGPDLFGTASDIDFVGWLGDAEEVHEFFANLALTLVALHIGYVLLFRRTTAWALLRGPRQPAPEAQPAKPVPAAASVVPAFAALAVTARQVETSDTLSFSLQVPPELRERFAAQPGQFVTLRVPCAKPPLLRCYSLSKPLGSDGVLRISVRRVAGGRASNWLADTLQIGQRIDVLPPAGRLVPDDLDGDLLLLAAGSGITPLRAIVQAVLEQGRGRVFLFQASRDAASLIFAEELADFAERYPERLQLRIWLDAEQGVPSGPAIAAKIADWPLGEAFVCGPPAFMAGASAALAGLGVASESIHVERFDAPEPAVLLSEPLQPARSRLHVALDGHRHALDVAHGEVLLDAMEQAGLQPPSACRAGICAACRCRVVDGSVSMRSNQVLSDQQVRQGWTLACQAVPTSARLEVEY